MSLAVETPPALEASLPCSDAVTGHKEAGIVSSHKRPHYVDAAIDFTGGTAGGIACVYVGQPLDTVKVKIQTFPHLYRNALDCFSKTFREEGVRRGLYSGTVPALVANVAENSILFMAYGQCQKVVSTLVGKQDVIQLNALENAIAGGCGAFFSSLALCPTELVKCKLQAMQQMKATGQAAAMADYGPWSLTKEIIRKEGVPGLFRGMVPTFMREMPGYFFFFGGYEISRSLLTPKGKTKDDIGPLATTFCGSIGGASLWIAIFPADVIKSRAQVAAAGTDPSLGFFRTFMHILRVEGFKALYVGLGPTVLRTIPATGAVFLAYESVKKFLTREADHYYDVAAGAV